MVAQHISHFQIYLFTSFVAMITKKTQQISPYFAILDHYPLHVYCLDRLSMIVAETAK